VTASLSDGLVQVTILGGRAAYQWHALEDGLVECVLDPEGFFGGPWGVVLKPSPRFPVTISVVKDTLEVLLADWRQKAITPEEGKRIVEALDEYFDNLPIS
jgi:hypothetical protein